MNIHELMMTTNEGETYLQAFFATLGDIRDILSNTSRNLSDEETQTLERVRQEVERMKGTIMEVIDNESDELVQQLLMSRNERSETALHCACKCNLPIEIVSKLIEKGGRELLLMKCARSKTALYYACKQAWQFNDSLEIVNALIDAGGNELVMQKTHEEETALFDAIIHDAPMEVISRLLEVGDEDLLFQTNNGGRNVLHVVSGWTSPDTIRELIRLGGKELVMAKSTTAFGVTALDQICMNADISIDIISTLIDIGGKELVMMRRGEHFVTVWFECVYMEEPEERRLPEHTQRLKLLFRALASPNENDDEDSIYEFGIGTLYGNFDSIGRQAWDEVWVPALQEVHQQYPNALLLHAAIIHDSKPFVIQDFTTKFDDSILLVKDSHNRYPIDVAVEKSLPWEDGMKEIFEKFTSIQQDTVQNKLLVAIRHGVKWDQGLKYILKESKVHVSHVDKITNLYPFMLAASEEKCDLDSLFNLIQANPHLVKQI